MKFQSKVTGLLCFFLLFSAMISTASADVLHGISYNHGRDYPQGDFSQFKARSLENCIQVCSKEHRCKAFSFESNTRLCRLKNDMGKMVKRRGITGGYKLATLNEGRDNRIRRSPNMNTMQGINLPGSDYDHFLSKSVSRCSDRCENDSRCRAFTYHKKRGACWLKSAVPGKKRGDSYISGIKTSRGNDRDGGYTRDDRPRRYEGGSNRGGGPSRYGGWGRERYDDNDDHEVTRYGGPQPDGRDRYDPRPPRSSRSSSNGFKMALMRKVNLPGADYAHFRVKKAEKCSKSCLNDSKCAAFTFNRSAKMCWLKSGRPSERYQAGYVSGIKVRRH